MKKAIKKTAAKKVTAPGAGGGYDQYKFFQGRQYTGMTVGRSHKWYYDKGVWIDKKITPDKWLINYEVTKRRAGKAPEGSGVPVGTEYHWYILAHQMVKKLDANSYSTKLNGLKYKLAHKRSTKGEWNISDETQRKHLIRIFEGFIEELKNISIEEFVASEGNLARSTKIKREAPKKAPKKAAKKTIKRQLVEEAM